LPKLYLELHCYHYGDDSDALDDPDSADLKSAENPNTADDLPDDFDAAENYLNVEHIVLLFAPTSL